jgi:hypothetical protein
LSSDSSEDLGDNYRIGRIFRVEARMEKNPKLAISSSGAALGATVYLSLKTVIKS